MLHPHIELIQAEISALTEEIEHLEALQKERDLDTTEQHQKDIATACLEKYQATLAKLNDRNMVNKVNAYQESHNTKKNEAQILFLLQFFYIVRLGQLGLFDVIQMKASPKDMLNAITDVCDQLIGASVYHATEPSTSIKSQKRRQVADILKKLDTSSEEVILEDISFKDIKDLIQHIWDNTVNEAQVLEKTLIDESAAKEWAVIQFENMVQSGEITPDIASEHKDEVEQQQSASEAKAEEAQESMVQETEVEARKQETEVEAPKQETEVEAPKQEAEVEAPKHKTEEAAPQQETKEEAPPEKQQTSVESQPSPAAEDLSAKDNNETSATTSEWDKKDVSEAAVVNDWNKTETREAPVAGEWSKKDNHVSNASTWDSNKDKLDTPVVNKEWTDTSHPRKSSRSSTKSSWKSNSRFAAESKQPENWNANEGRGWSNVIDNAVKVDAWDNADTGTTNAGADNKNWTASPSPPPAATKDKQQEPSDNWTSTPDEQQQQKPIETDVQQQSQPQQQVNTPPASPKLIDTKEQQQESYNSETNDNWRRRGIEDINNSRGRGSSYRGGYRGSSRSGKFRSAGSSGGGRRRSVGRGRGRGRGADFGSEEQHHSSPSQ
ncbi:hypothetical protein MUCCIDRAFT_109191 [Mucor lusitanicus CBS 277.49]|uniref:Uncharacterized protein n=2 Tax=Mucor circinelloides f. lusitanicus TaxID=29924 RepID=A0A168MT51_MUCCL|nr:hypothetical protein MUCCIDRAFT_109191 [Mucor lusitanicus CBS 277.49]